VRKQPAWGPKSGTQNGRSVQIARRLAGPTPLRPLPRRTQIAILALIWEVCWFVSVLFFYTQSGVLPNGADEWWGYPLVCSAVALPASFGRVLQGLFFWLPGVPPDMLWTPGAIAFWPCCITFLVLALRTGKRRYFAVLGAMSLPASIYWHFISVGAKGV